MKKIINLSVMLVLAIAAFMMACNKSGSINDTKQPYSNEHLQNHYQSSLIQTLDTKINFASGKKTRLTKGQAVKTIAADAGGAWGGAEVGAKIGVFFGGNAILGGLIGGVICGVGSSVLANCSPVGPHTTPNATNGTFNNQYEQVGFLHNKYCRQTLVNGDFTINNSSAYIDNHVIQYTSLIQSELACPYAFASCPPALLAELKTNSIKAAQISDFASAKSYIEGVSTDRIGGAVLISLMDRIFQIDTDVNYDLIFTYTNEYITLVQNDNNLGELQRAKLLISLNVLKASAQLWKIN
jgi:hypothetical protein